MLQIVWLHVECKKFCKLITFTKKLLDEVNYSFKTICSETTTKHFGNLSILPIQLIKKALSVDFESPLFKSH